MDILNSINRRRIRDGVIGWKADPQKPRTAQLDMHSQDEIRRVAAGAYGNSTKNKLLCSSAVHSSRTSEQFVASWFVSQS